ncbi:MAG: Phenylalanyl-tRNA synthetase beta chain [uncultured Chthoniobacterales bacterium]|uniref:Phenylalanine--tRNA ligase beta subunit n=1 Tax=uncultured Chthoniobacterales bacterium TaxID=1836801 RepID=A0A6J4INJ8_9BACT|nr:MAG: Phenylalanyl-tRNA synthetase beta chain [uncultured Chthoniobacterales bacterium]
MKFSVNWLREFVDLPATTEALADLLTFAGVEIEGVEERGGNFDNVVVAQIRESVQHPNADRLSVCQVDDGSGTNRQIVCGAKNYKVGDKVPLAVPGAALPNGLKIKASKLRGVESQGMLCSPSELKVSEDSDGLLILGADAPIGAPFASLYQPDTILDVEITPNRPDLLSYFGLARETAALTSKSVKPVNVDANAAATGDGVTIRALRECPFYSARRIENVTVGPSPSWLRTKLEASGIRAINNIVDITNYVMLEVGQPLHAFDADKLDGAIDVRLATPGEKFLALDGKTYQLSERDLMIADQARAVAIGGVMGGEDTGVTNSTRNVLLEAAYFLPSSIRRTARTLNLPSDASYRFERGVDPGMTLRASARAAELIQQIAGGTPAAEISVAGAPLERPTDVSLRYERCNQLLGVTVGSQQVDSILQQFGLTRSSAGTADASVWSVPSHRRDLQREVDLIEEVVRAYGIDKIAPRHRSRFTPQSDADRAADLQSVLRQRLVALGLFEARTSALISRADASTSARGAVDLKNPLSEDHVALRPSLTAGLLDVLMRNQNMGASSIRLFELGRVFAPPDATERRSLGLLFSGETARAPHWRATAKRQLDFFDLKGAIEALRIPELGFRRAEHPAFALAAEITAAGEVIGLAGQLATERATQLGAAAPVFLAQIDLEPLCQSARSGCRYEEIDKYPAVSRDIAMIVPEALSHVEVEGVLAAANEPLVQSVRLFDLFSGREGSSVGSGKKSLAYTLTYRDKNRTLTGDEVTVVHTRIRERLKSELGAELRE